MDIDRRAFLAMTAAASACSSRLAAQSATVLRPEDFGARGDGVSSDARAFAALSAELNRRGGGTIVLASKRTYVVGGQTPGGVEFGWTPAPVIHARGLVRPLAIIGNGARLRCQSGLRFGAFDRASGEPVHRKGNLRHEELASPYWALIRVQNCRGPVAIRDLELDGSLERLRIGGRYGDTGWQVPATGLLIDGNVGEELVENVYSHHHGQDGAMIIGDPRRSARSRITRLVSRDNGRQGLSITGGRGYDFEDCEFSRSGRSAISSAPGAGVDIESEGRPIRDLTFTRCKFLDNAGAGLVADSGDIDSARFADCLFVGTTSWAAWPNKPHFAFDRCTFVGAITNALADADPARATRFTRCRFTDVADSGRVFVGDGAIASLGKSDNVLFDDCTFDLRRDGVLPWSWRATYRDCTMSQASPKTAQTKGRYLGRTTIHGPVDLYGSMIQGTVILNGRAVPQGPVGGDVRPW